MQLGDCILLAVLVGILAALGGYHAGRRRALRIALARLEQAISSVGLSVSQKIKLYQTLTGEPHGTEK